MNKKTLLNLLLILVLGGLGGVLLDRVVLPYLASISVFRRFPLLNPNVPLVITRREEIRIDEGINNSEVASKVKNSLVSVYLHENDFGSPKFRLLDVMNGVIVTNDGIIVLPAFNFRSNQLLTVLIPDQKPLRAKILATDNLMGLTFLKVTASNLPVAKQGLSEEAQAGERLLAVWRQEDGATMSVNPVMLLRTSHIAPGLVKVYELTKPNVYLTTNPNPETLPLGAVVASKDGLLVGFVTRTGDGKIILRSEDLKLAIDNFLADQKIVWPDLKLNYQILGQQQTSLLGLKKSNGVLVKSAVSPFRENDFIYMVNGRELSTDEGFQELVLEQKRGSKVRFGILRNGEEKEIEVNL